MFERSTGLTSTRVSAAKEAVLGSTVNVKGARYALMTDKCVLLVGLVPRPRARAHTQMHPIRAHAHALAHVHADTLYISHPPRTRPLTATHTLSPTCPAPLNRPRVACSAICCKYFWDYARSYPWFISAILRGRSARVSPVPTTRTHRGCGSRATYARILPPKPHIHTRMRTRRENMGIRRR